MLLNTIKNEEQKKYSNEKIMKKFRFKPMYLAAAAVVAVGISIAACGEDMTRIIQQFTVGRYATFVGGDDIGGARLTAEQEQALLTAVETSEGVTVVELPDGSVLAVRSVPAVFSYEAEIEREKNTVTYFDTINDVKPYLAFNPLMPVSLPSGFAIDRICLFNDENGRPIALGSNMYLEVYYTDVGKTQQIYMQLRLMNEETAFWASAGRDMRHITVNGHKGVVDGKNVHVEINGVMYMILAGVWADGVTQDDVIRIAESLM